MSPIPPDSRSKYALLLSLNTWNHFSVLSKNQFQYQIVLILLYHEEENIISYECK
ncbi:hypothetical protein YC2023_118043 [Brassica napus]